MESHPFINDTAEPILDECDNQPVAALEAEPTVSPSTDSWRSDEDEISMAELFYPSSLKLMIVPLICGLFYGYNMVVGIFYQLRMMAMDCSMANGGREICETLPYADCRWYTNSSNGGYCGWTDVTCRVLYPAGMNMNAGGGMPMGMAMMMDMIMGMSKDTEQLARSGCIRDDRCEWSYNMKMCMNPVGYDSLHHAIYTVSLTTGGAIGALFGSPVVERFGLRIIFLTSGIISCACSVMFHVSVATNDFWVLIASRFVLGLCVGITGVASPLYVDQNSPPSLRRPVGYVYMFSMCLGMLLTSAMGLLLGQTIHFESNSDLHFEARIQVLAALSTLLAVSVLLLGVFVKESRVNFTSHTVKGAVDVDPNEYSYTQMLPRLALTCVVCCAFQLTGENAVSSYAPQILKNFGLAPLVGMFVMMAISLIAAGASVLLSTRVSSRSIFLWGTLASGLFCVLMCGIPAYPGVTSNTTRDVVAIIGMMLYIGVFHLCIGPCFYVITQEIFPLSFRPKGAAFAQALQFAIRMAVGASYPFAIKGLSGGASGDQNKGQAIVFFFFGGVGVVCFTIQIFLLHPWYKGEPQLTM